MTLGEKREYRDGVDKVVDCEPQTVDVTAQVDKDGLAWHCAHWSFTGVVTYSEQPDEVGQIEQIGQTDDYCDSIAYALLRGEEIKKGLQIEATPLYRPFRDERGRGFYTGGLFVEPAPTLQAQHDGVEMAVKGEELSPADADHNTLFGWLMAKESLARRESPMAAIDRQIETNRLLQAYAPEFLPFAKPDLPGVEF